VLVAGFALGALLIVDGTGLAAKLVSGSHDSNAFLAVLVPIALGGSLMLAAYRRFRFGELLERRVTFRRRKPGGLNASLRAWGELSRELMETSRR
jgi:hypothetical protein